MLYSFIAPTVHQCNTEATKATQNKRNRNHKATEATKAIEPTKAKCQLVKPTNIQKNKRWPTVAAHSSQRGHFEQQTLRQNCKSLAKRFQCNIEGTTVIEDDRR